MKKLFCIALIVLLAGCGQADENQINNNLTNNSQESESQNGEAQTDGQQENTSNGTENLTNKDTENTSKEKGYIFEYNGAKVAMDMDAVPVIEALGEPKEYYEVPSCAFDGLDKIYNYGSFIVETYEQNGKDYISTVCFYDDLVETPEGITLYATRERVLEVYGVCQEEEANLLVYRKDGMVLRFLLKDDEVVSIEYISGILAGE